MKIIQSKYEGKKAVGQICESVYAEKTNISHELKLVHECGFVFMRQEGKRRVYSLNSQTVKPILDIAQKHVRKYCKHQLVKKGTWLRGKKLKLG